MKKIAIIFTGLFLFSSNVLAQDIDLNNLPGTGGAPITAPQVPSIPQPNNPVTLPGSTQGSNSAPGGLPGSAQGSNSAPGGLPGTTQGSNSAPDVYGQPNNGSGQAGQGAFLQLVTPNNHGLPGEEGIAPMLQRVIDNGLGVIALVGIFAIIIASLQLWLAQGKADGIGKAKVNIFNIVLGFAIVMLAWSGVTVALKFLGF